MNNDLIRNKSRCILSSFGNTPTKSCRINGGALRSSGTVSATKTAPRCLVVRVLSKWIDDQLILRSWNGAILTTICPGNSSVFVQGNIVCHLVRKLAVHKELPPLIGTINLSCCKCQALCRRRNRRQITACRIVSKAIILQVVIRYLISSCALANLNSLCRSPVLRLAVFIKTHYRKGDGNKLTWVWIFLYRSSALLARHGKGGRDLLISKGLELLIIWIQTCIARIACT